MKQVVQNFRDGELHVAHVPPPALRPGGVLVATEYSIVSAGTERSKVDLARKNLIAKAMARPDQVRQVVAAVRRDGLAATYHKVMNKLDALAPLGYSVSGRVVEVGAGCAQFAVGDLVACGGAGHANHAELVWVPGNLCAAVPAGVEPAEAAFATIGAIALHGVRQAEARLGETVVVIGLGLLGQLAVQLLTASGCRVIGVDVDPWKLELARAAGAERAVLRSDDVVAHTLAATRGRGADAVVIAAATSTNDPFVLAGELARDRAHVVLVGAVPIEIPRSPYYEKELDVRLSRSYGPGRYDAQYEDKGLDYPIGYVRWTENRNMEAFLDAVAAKQVKLGSLLTHRFALDDAERAYDLLTGARDERFLAIALSYPGAPARGSVPNLASAATARGRTRIGFIGAGSFAGGTLIPALGEVRGVSLATVCTASGLGARDAALRHGFAASASDPAQVFDDPAIDAVVIATRHDSHASLARDALAAGKAVFVEKPLALTRAQLADVVAAARANPALMVGFNRRFSPHTERVQRALARRAGAVVIAIRVNAGPIPATSWIHDPEVGGGRILGEVCHFIDLAGALAGARPRSVRTVGIGSGDPAARLRDNVTIAIDYADGSIATIVYTAKGDPASGKERVEVFGDGVSAVIDDFHTSTITRRGAVDRVRGKPDKGHRAQMARFAAMVAHGGAAPIALDELEASSLATIAAVESLAQGAAREV